MTQLQDIAAKVRSKNAGPFWLTIDVFCGTDEVFQRVRQGLHTDEIARLFRIAPDQIKRFDIAELHVIKLSLPRPTIQGISADRDMHGASFAEIVKTLEIST